MTTAGQTSTRTRWWRRRTLVGGVDTGAGISGAGGGAGAGSSGAAEGGARDSGRGGDVVVAAAAGGDPGGDHGSRGAVDSDAPDLTPPSPDLTPRSPDTSPGRHGATEDNSDAISLTEPRATAMLFMGTGRPHEPGAVPQVRLSVGELLVRVELATICGSDVHTVLGHRTEPTPLVLGHEAVGRISHLGPGGARYADGREAVVGDRVVWSVAVHCGACDRCVRGLTQKCRALRKYGHERLEHGWELTGGFASHVHLLAGTPLVQVREEVPAQVLAPAGCGIATAWAALAAAERTVALSGATVLVTGGGLIGLAATAMATERGATVIVSDPDPERRSLALRFGAAEVVDPAAGKLTCEVDVAIEASGATGAVSAGVDALAVGGVAVWVGSVFPTNPIQIVPERVVRGLATVTGVHNYTPAELEGAVQFLHEHWQQFPFQDLVGEVLPLEELDIALERAAQHREVRVGITTTPA